MKLVPDRGVIIDDYVISWSILNYNTSLDRPVCEGCYETSNTSLMTDLSEEIETLCLGCDFSLQMGRCLSCWSDQLALELDEDEMIHLIYCRDCGWDFAPSRMERI